MKGIRIINKTGLIKDTEILNHDGEKIHGAYKIELPDFDVHNGFIEAIVYFRPEYVDIKTKDKNTILVKDNTVFGDSWVKGINCEEIYPYTKIVEYIIRNREKPDCEPCRHSYLLKTQIPPCGECLPELNDDELKIIKLYYLLWNPTDSDNLKVNHKEVWRCIDEFNLVSKPDAFEVMVNLLRKFR